MAKKDDLRFVGFKMEPKDYYEFKAFLEEHGHDVSAGMRLAVRRALADRIAFLTGNTE